jgi:sulfonate transport system substrate-binding protein
MRKLVLAFFALFVLFLVGCSQKDPARVAQGERVLRIGFPSANPFPTDTLAIVKEKGFVDAELAKINAKIEIINFAGSGPAINEAFASKNLDAAIYGDVPNIVAKSNGVDTTLVAIQHLVANAGIVVPVDSPVTNITGLKGKTVATVKGSFMHRTLVLMLAANGMTLDDIQFVNMGSQEAVPALLSGKIDSALLATTNLGQVLADGEVKLVLDCTENPEWKGSEGYVIRTEYLKENPDITEALVRALFQALDYLHKNPDETKQIWTKSGFSRKTFDYMYPDNTFPFNLSLNDTVISTYEDVEKFLLDNGLIKNQFSIRDWANSDFINKIK